MSTSKSFSVNQKGFAPILIIILIAALAIGGYLVYSDKIGVYQNQPKPIPSPQPMTQPSPSPATIYESTNSAETANWKTYTHYELGYTVKYPETWLFDEPNYQLTYSEFTIKTPDLKREGDSYYSIVKGSQISISVGKYATKLNSIDDYFDKNKFMQQITANRKHIIIDGQPAIRFDQAYEGINSTNIIFLYNGLLYTIGIHFPITDNSRTTNLDVYEKLVNSFRLAK
ncbi:hypothetical protein A3B45_01330 [Candidatus Daviesbacteria bacterium RIFCSPLOWO2_01_FULL_39_12]|uniref:PsbP C-terminal domain-containing protein n=1 Tax=Candidatus Daviesbacteria bacterium RIFCSPLOWO2_01_FULL_39_12 TaxID=1797785 RepID=A0A1F5KQQ7_9BACT|nr:MAG: hypothetical protein A3D79_00510 [Candidatus Daviesbacteria bacterium RIFCSPHIGHO2_02_FULL_39_8]OGE43160.1 MAG: hypothetical protein A3B45_01330 [Candidatus Daviesbacteria bacterium RIFCSPLOWO2_01_FULL_39_12]